MVAEVTARRLDSPLDSILRLTNATGKELAVNDDYRGQGRRAPDPPRRFAHPREAAGKRSLLPVL